jgi:hypothetical protein
MLHSAISILLFAVLLSVQMLWAQVETASSVSSVTPTELPVPVLSSTPVQLPNPAPTQVLKKFYPIQDPIPLAKESIYSKKIYKVLKDWPPSYIPKGFDQAHPIWIRAVRTKGNSDYIGVVKKVFIPVALEKVAALMESFEKYKEIFPEVVEVKITERQANYVYTHWERESPAFFVPNIKYDQVYAIDNRSPDRKIYRYQLISGNSVNFSDGLVVLERVQEGTILTAWDFFEGNFGLAKTFAEGHIWKRVMQGTVRADLSFIAKAEHPSWTLKQIEEASKKLMEDQSLDSVPFLQNFEME